MKEESVVFRPTKVTLVAILLSSMLILMGGAAVAPALNDIKLAFPGQDFLTSLIITLPSLAVALVGYAVGIAADRYGKVKVLLLKRRKSKARKVAFLIPRQISLTRRVL